VHVYAALNCKGVCPPVVLRRKKMNVTAATYVQAVLPQLVDFSHRTPGRYHIFQQDGAPAHTASQTVHWMDCCPLLDQRLAQDVWPPQSPDLNVIENFWSYIATRVQNHKPKSERALVAAIRTEFAQVSTALCETLVDSMPSRLAEVIERAGAPTDY